MIDVQTSRLRNAERGITECGILYPDVVLWSVELADALIKKLKGE